MKVKDLGDGVYVVTDMYKKTQYHTKKTLTEMIGDEHEIVPDPDPFYNEFVKLVNYCFMEKGGL